MASENPSWLQAQMHVSLIVPVYNAEATLRALFERIGDVGRQSGLEFEIVVVDDASQDGSLAILRDIAASSANVVIIANPVNRGQAAATPAGIAASRNDIVVMLDDDLKHQPEDIPGMLAVLKGAGPNALVMGIFAGERRALWRIMGAIGANAISNLFLDKPLPLRSSTFCAFGKSLCGNIDRSGGGNAALVTELVQAAAVTLTLPVLPGMGQSETRETRYTLDTLFRLFMKRTGFYRPRRVMIGLALCWFATFAMTWLLLQSRPVGAMTIGALWLACAGATFLMSMIAFRVWFHSNGVTRKWD